MKTLKRQGLLSARLALGVLGLVLLLGCGETPTAPTTDVAGEYRPSSAATDIKTKTKLKEPKVDSVSVTKAVGPQGDTVKAVVDPRGRTTGLFVPPGALLGQTQITMIVTQPRRIVGKQFEYEFGPHGLTFRFVSTLYIDIPQPNGTRATLSWLNPETNLWEFQGTAVVVNGRASFTLINHFSKYGINYRGTGS